MSDPDAVQVYEVFGLNLHVQVTLISGKAFSLWTNYLLRNGKNISFPLFFHISAAPTPAPRPRPSAAPPPLRQQRDLRDHRPLQPPHRPPADRARPAEAGLRHPQGQAALRRQPRRARRPRGRLQAEVWHAQGRRKCGRKGNSEICLFVEMF